MLAQELIKQAAWMMDNDANQMIVLLANVFAKAVRQTIDQAAPKP